MADTEEAPPEVHHYENRQEVPWDIQNYWSQRYRIFSKYDEGIWLTDDAWFGVTPEPVAKSVETPPLLIFGDHEADIFGSKIAAHLAEGAPTGRSILVDAFAGAGGNSIAFARTGKWKRVYAIEKDPVVLQCAKHNAKILKNQLKDLAPYGIIFASPPWGGPGYRSDQVFSLRTMEPYSLETLYKEFTAFTKHVVLYLPRSSDVKQLAKFVPDDDKATVMHYCVEGHSKALCIYFGDFNVQ